MWPGTEVLIQHASTHILTEVHINTNNLLLHSVFSNCLCNHRYVDFNYMQYGITCISSVYVGHVGCDDPIIIQSCSECFLFLYTLLDL